MISSPIAGLRTAAPRLPDSCGLYLALALALHDGSARRPEDEVSVLEVPVRIKVPWSQLSALVR